MKIKKLEKNELFDAFKIAAYCFHMRIEDIEATREEAEADENVSWGAFDEDGTMMAKIIDNKYDFYFDGQVIPCGGIGGVSTLPEYRDRGAVREIFRALLPDAYRSGEILSTLYPFNHEFYRKQGYEIVTFKNEYTFAPVTLKGYRFTGEVHKWDMQESVKDFLDIYREYASKYNLSMDRTEENMLDHMKVEKPYIDRKFSYILKVDQKPVAYVIFTDIRHDPAAILQVKECAWTCREGFYAILGFLARFESDYGEIKLQLPMGIDLLRIIRSALAYDIGKRTRQNFMVRVINAKGLLERIRKPENCDFTVKVTDEIIEENNGTFRVLSDRVDVLECNETKKADLELDVRALGQMAVGAVNFDEALLRKDVTVNSNEELLRKVFVEKKILVTEEF
ncbi:MAG: GNAT family N-acetyltransferase [Lachnospiraceae bacterium]|nr:GNAT family N-acetyltransferase [Lachnospiraceae bacterium]